MDGFLLPTQEITPGTGFTPESHKRQKRIVTSISSHISGFFTEWLQVTT